MKLLAGIIAASTFILPAAASGMDVQTFLDRVHSLQRLGPLAPLSKDFNRLKRVIQADEETLKADYARAQAENRSVSYCPPKIGKPKFSKEEFLAAANAVPKSERETTNTKDVLRTLMERKYPCSG